MVYSGNLKYGSVEWAEACVVEAESALERAKERLELARKQGACKHENLDDAVISGNTCLDCGFYLNNGI